jgi:zinc protease
VTSVEGIDEYRLANGLRVLLFPDPSQETTTVNITYLVGSLHEGYGETGMAHLLEHLLFKGSTNHPDIPQELTAHGARPNGTTWTDRTNYFETFAATDENLEWALDLEADRMLNAYVSREDLDSEMTVVRNEFEIGENNPARILNERIYATAYIWHNYGNTTIGARSDIENVPIENLKRFYETWYRPENAVLVVAGKLDGAKTLSLISEKFGPLQNPDIPLPQVYTEEPAQDGERSVMLRRVGDVAVAATAYHVPAGSHPDHPAVRVLAYLLADEPSGHLYRALVETHEATAVSANADRWRDPGLLYVEAEVRKDGDVVGVQSEMIELVESFGATAPPEEAVGRARTSYLRDFDRSLRSSSWAAIGLTEWAAAGDWRLLFLYRDRIEAVTPEDVQRVAQEYLVSANRTSGLYVPTDGPSRAEVPAAPDVATMLEGYEGREAMAMGEAFDPTPANIETRVIRKNLPVGLDLVLLPKSTRGETVHLALNTHMGTETSLSGKAYAGELTARMLLRGTESRTRQEIEDELNELRSSLSAWGGAQGVTAIAETTGENLARVVEILADVLRHPTFPGDELDRLKEELLARSEEQRSDPRSQARITLDRHMSPFPPDHPEYVATPEERIQEIKKVSRGDLQKFHQSFYGVDHAELAIVGDFDPAEIEALVDELFAGFDAAEDYVRIETPYREADAIFESVETPDKESAVFASAGRMPIKDDHEDHPALTLAGYIAGGGFLNSRLATRIRRTDGLSYGVGAWYGADSQEPDGWFRGYAIYAPQNDDALVRAFWEELQKIESDGFTAAEVMDARQGWLQRQRLSRSQDRELATRLANYAEIGRTLAWDADMEAAVESLGPNDLHDAWKRHIDLGTISIVRAGDFSRVKTAELATP